MYKLILKGFAMGLADVVPGVSGGTIAFITGIYDTLIYSISRVNSEFIKLLLTFKIKEALEYINIKFLLPLFMGIIVAIISMSRAMHYLMNEYSIETWSLFFGLIIASIVYMLKQVKGIKTLKPLLSILSGTTIGVLIVSLIPVSTPNGSLYLFFSGMVAICAMILPGISGSFLLLILGKYAFVTGALKNPFNLESIQVIISFSLGCLVGLLSFSKVLNYFLKSYKNLMICFLIGFMIGSLKKIWPWKEILETKVVRGKIHVLKEMNYLPSEINSEVIMALGLALFGFFIVFGVERISKK
jgi:putative membrane protein